MKRKTSISVSAQLLKMIDSLPNKPARSEVIEEALVLYFKNRKTIARDRSDLDILNSRSSGLNQEALDVLEFQSFGTK
jgi:metal-responsive CopG/Arc/MetJ family transcriptional regulator